MAVPANTPPMHRYQYELISPADSGPYRGTVDAAYFVTEDGYTLFKDSTHAVVTALRSEFVYLIERVADVPQS